MPGFVRAEQVRRYSSIRDELHAAVHATVRAHPEANEFYVTGHSLGAAQSILGLADLASTFPEFMFRGYAAATYR